MKYFKSFIIILAILLFVFGVSGCKEKGPAEKAGQKLDESMEKAGDQVKDLLDK